MVLLGQNLCGHIVAVREDIPWANMVPIVQTFHGIKSQLRTHDVRLPTHAEVELAASSLDTGKGRSNASYIASPTSSTKILTVDLPGD